MSLLRMIAVVSSTRARMERRAGEGSGVGGAAERSFSSSFTFLVRCRQPKQMLPLQAALNMASHSWSS